MRVTDSETMDVVEMVLGGLVNKEIVNLINQNGGKAVGLTGKDGDFIRAKKIHLTRAVDEDDSIEIIDLGQVGEVSSIDPAVVDMLSHSDFIPVIAPIGTGPNGETFNINADTAAGAIAAALKATKLMMLTDVPGILTKDKQLISEIDAGEIDALIADGTITGGMIPKVETCVSALRAGVKAAHILDGRIPHVLLIETFTEHGASTMIRA